MGYFPFYTDIGGKRGLIVGGGTVALRKAEKLLPFSPLLTVAAPKILPELVALPGVTAAYRPFSPELLDGAAFVIAASDDRETNQTVSLLCRDRGLPVNVVDDKALCTFLFPALVKRGPLCAAVTTEGSSPTAAAWLRKQIERLLPDDLENILEEMQSLRETAKDLLPTEQARATALSSLLAARLEAGHPLTPEESTIILNENRKNIGRVYLVGAGCGSADLITVRGLDLLKTCDAVVYDELLDPALLEASFQAEKYPMGKRKGRHSAHQEEINMLLISLAQEGMTVVRLKGGDPFVFGRGGEEALALQQAGVPFEIVPGVSSAIAIPTLAGIPVTHRGMSQGVHIVTAHTAASNLLPDYFHSLAHLPGTLVVLMGLSRLEEIADCVISAGKDPTVPVAVLSGGNAPHPTAVRGTLADIASRTREAGVQPPAVIVIGPTAGPEFNFIDGLF